MPLSAESKIVLEHLASQNIPPLHSLPAAEGRAFFNATFKTQPTDQEPVTRIEEKVIPVDGGNIPARVYAPAGTAALPALVHFHGGGWVLMNLDSHDGICRQLSNRTGAVVVSVEYRKAPEFKAPIAAEDCYAALQWVVDNAAALGIDVNRIGVIGDSAGGNLAAAVTLLARDRNGPKIKCQVLTYPAVDATMSAPSIKENATAPLLGEGEMKWFWGHYLDGAKVTAKDTRVSPLFASSLANLPPAFVSTAEYDPLRDEGEDYARKLHAAGVTVESKRYNSVFHGFALMGKIIPEGRQLLEAQTAFLAKYL